MLRTANPCTANRSKQSRKKGMLDSSLGKGNEDMYCRWQVRYQPPAGSHDMYGYVVGTFIGLAPFDSGCSLRELCSGICIGTWCVLTAWSIFQHASLIASCKAALSIVPLFRLSASIDLVSHQIKRVNLPVSSNSRSFKEWIVIVASCGALGSVVAV